jgi:hypothetical protein
MSLELVPVSLRRCQDFVTQHHRHNAAPRGWKFGVGVAVEGELIGVAVAGRPVARHFDDGATLEVTRTCTLGHANANSRLYGAIVRAGFALGYTRIITYTQADESGASLRAAGFRVIAERPARKGWNTLSRPRSDADYTSNTRTLWEVDR